MPYDQANTVARAYASTRAFNALEDKAESRWFELSSFGDDPEHLSDDEIRKALDVLRIVRAYQASAAQSGNHVLREYDEAINALGQ
jgi:hypothetical protein